MREIQDRLNQLENVSYDHPPRENYNTAFDITYGRTTENVRNQHDPVNTYIEVKEARDKIPEILRNQV